MALKGSGKIVDELARKKPPPEKKISKKKKEKEEKEDKEEEKEEMEVKVEEEVKMKMEEEKVEQSGEQEATTVASKKTLGKGTKKGKKGIKKKANSLDSIARFFNDYGESPHL